MGGGLLSDGTWAIHSVATSVSGAPITGVDGDTWVGMFPQRISLTNPMGSVNVFDPLEGRVLYMLVDVLTNNDSIGFSIELRRNALTSPAKILFDPDEVGRKALLLNIPYLTQEFMQYRIIKPQNFSIVNFTVFFAGKLTGSAT